MWTKRLKTFFFLFVILYPFLSLFFYSRHVLLELNKYNAILYYVIEIFCGVNIRVLLSKKKKKKK